MGVMKMYQLGDKVVYGSHGVCSVVGQEERVIDKRQVTYLALEPVGQGGSRFLVPTHNAAAMGKVRPVLSREALEELLSSDLVKEDAWILDEGQRKQLYRELISSCNRQRLAQMVCSLYRYRTAQTAAGAGMFGKDLSADLSIHRGRGIDRCAVNTHYLTAEGLLLVRALDHMHTAVKTEVGTSH